MRIDQLLDLFFVVLVIYRFGVTRFDRSSELLKQNKLLVVFVYFFLRCVPMKIETRKRNSQSLVKSRKLVVEY